MVKLLKVLAWIGGALGAAYLTGQYLIPLVNQTSY